MATGSAIVPRPDAVVLEAMPGQPERGQCPDCAGPLSWAQSAISMNVGEPIRGRLDLMCVACGVDWQIESDLGSGRYHVVRVEHPGGFRWR